MTSESPRAQVRDLALRLADEYAGEVPAGRVLALVFRTECGLARLMAVTDSSRLALCETLVRGRLSGATRAA
jgi:hypothetical protein